MLIPEDKERGVPEFSVKRTWLVSQEKEFAMEHDDIQLTREEFDSERAAREAKAKQKEDRKRARESDQLDPVKKVRLSAPAYLFK